MEESKMRKLFTIDDIMVAFISALGYGYGLAISGLYGWPYPMCMVASLVVGLVITEVINRTIYSEVVQSNPTYRYVFYIAFIVIFILAHVASVVWLGVSMVDYAVWQLVFVIGMPVIGFVLNLLIRWLRIRRIRNLYGDGSQGYVFHVKNKDIEALNQQNRPISGKYNKRRAVRTRTGIYVGEKYKGTLLFMGIPYARPPVGELRWKAPEPLPDSDAVYEAVHFGNSAIQVEHKGSLVKMHRQSEDCLTLNIGINARKEDEKKPVLVLFHHGDFTSGGSVDPLLYGGDYVSRHQDIVFVSFNYRLGIFGFIDFSEVPGGEACPDAMNLGLLDQIAALQWIRENIAAFGGDPDRITVLGIDSGATSICLLAASERAKGLFQRAFVFNGTPTMAYDTPEGARTLARALLNETKTSTMAELMQLSTESLKEAAQKLWQYMCSPTCDGTLIPVDVFRAWQDGTASDIEFIVGISGGVTQMFRSVLDNQNYEDLIAMAAAGIQSYTEGAIVDEIKTYIEAETAKSGELEAKSKFIEQFYALCVYRSAVKLEEGGSKVHMMYWAEKPLIEKLGSGTVDVIATLLGNDEALEMYGGMIDKDLSVTLQILLKKYVSGEDLKLYLNEIRGVEALDWEAFPKALIVSNEKLECGTIPTEMFPISLR